MQTRAKIRAGSLAAVVLCVLFATAAFTHAADDPQSRIKSAVDSAIQPMMAQYGIPGMAVGITVGGKPYVFCYGVASRQTHRRVTRDTLFEIGSVSKTFTATLASYAQLTGHLSLSDKTSTYLPALRGAKFGNVSLLNLGTHTPGGIPLQVPDNIHNDAELMHYLQHWRPTYKTGTYRTYSNLGIGTLGLIAARSMGQDFATLMDQRLFPALGMQDSFIHVPKNKMARYAQGYTTAGTPIRMAPGELWAEAYGIKTTAPDMLRFVEANMNLIPLDKTFQRAITDTHTAYFHAGPMTQDLIWEQYPYPVALQTLLAGNSSAMAFDATPVSKIRPPESPHENVWINKTGSTNGFAAYVAFIPEKHLGIVMLANRNFPVDARVTAAYKILSTVADGKDGVRK